MQRTCKCHGVSGSCTTQTCWLQLPEFREVGNYLKEKYHRALKVDLLRGAGNSAASRGAIAETFSSISRKELVHLEDSPDYCLENRTLGFPGTEGRECLKKGKNLSKWEKRSCKRLCGECGLAVEERKAETLSSCNCKFHWCCAVKCEQCRKTVTKYFCVKKGGQRVRNESAGSRRKGLRLRKKHWVPSSSPRLLIRPILCSCSNDVFWKRRRKRKILIFLATVVIISYVSARETKRLHNQSQQTG